MHQVCAVSDSFFLHQTWIIRDTVTVTKLSTSVQPVKIDKACVLFLSDPCALRLSYRVVATNEGCGLSEQFTHAGMHTETLANMCEQLQG